MSNSPKPTEPNSGSFKKMMKISQIKMAQNPKTTLGTSELERYQRFIWDTLKIAYPPGDSQESRIKLVGPAPMAEWDKARKHKSFEPNNRKNLETLENVGDQIMGLIIKELAIKSNPDITEGQLTFLQQQKVWKGFQAQIADDLGLPEFVKTLYTVTKGTKEDLLEAFFGALWTVGDQVLGKGNGYALAFNAMQYLYAGYDIILDPTKLKNAKVQLKEIIEGLKWVPKGEASVTILGKPYQEPDGTWRLTYRLPPVAMKWIQDQGYQTGQGSNIIADVSGPNPDDILWDAATAAVRALSDRWGIDVKTVAGYSEAVKPKMPPGVQARMDSDGYTEIRVRMPDPDDIGNENYYQLIGTRASGPAPLEIVLTVIDPSRPRYAQAQQKLLRLYERSGKQPLGTIINLK